MPRGDTGRPDGNFKRTAICGVCNKRYRGSVRMVNKLFKLHMKVQHPSKKCRKFPKPSIDQCVLTEHYNPSHIAVSQFNKKSVQELLTYSLNN